MDKKNKRAGVRVEEPSENRLVDIAASAVLGSENAGRVFQGGKEEGG
jgi:hypothetical protein